MECPGIGVNASMNPSPSNEASGTTLTGTITDPFGNGLYDIFIVWGDGYSDTQLDVTALTFSAGHTYADDGQYAVEVTVIDISDREDATGVAHVVNNLPPIPTISGSGGGPEGTLQSFSGSAVDPADPHDMIVSLDWSVTKNGYPYAGGSGSTLSFTPDDNGNYVVTLTAADEDGGVGSTSTSFAITNVPPTLSAAIVPATSVEGSSVTVSGSYTDPGTADTHVISIDWGEVDLSGQPIITSVTGSNGSFSATHVYADDGGDGTFGPGNGTPEDDYNIHIVVTDDDGDSDEGLGVITVQNAAPTFVMYFEQNPAMAAGNLYVTWYDAGNDYVTIDVLGGDGSGDTYEDLFPAAAPVISHMYSAFGSYTITVTITDDDLGTITDTLGITLTTM